MNSDRSFPHIIGAKAEIAYAALTNQEVDTNLYSMKGDYSDFGPIEIKSSTWEGEDIELKVKVREFNRKKPAVYVLARVRMNEVQFLGAISRKRFDREKYLKKHKFVENYCVLASDLTRCLPYIKDNKLIKNDF